MKPGERSRAAYWRLLRQLRRIRHPEIGRGSRVAWRARIEGERRAVRIGTGCWIDSECQLDARGGGLIDVGDQCELHRFAFVMTYGGTIRIGNGCSVNPFTVLYGHGGLSIGNNVRIATHVTVIPANHRFDLPETPISQQGISARGIVIEDDVWIGSGARILDGCRVGRGSIIGAGAVVTRDIEPYSIAFGVPARRVAARGERS